ncbi:hypothetical protein [Photobacterium phosphoreum]|uniref:hypothetical protein n=1 Tax=Photobacterium phosphoreum TaxID=659 RepID=UPI0039AEFF08
MTNSPSIYIEKLTIIGTEKNYEISFKKGINIIWGDLDCGKSSILNLISYSLGASSIDTYEQLESKARLCQLSVYLNDDKYIFERDIFDSKQYIRCYKNEINKNVTPRILAATLDQENNAPDGYISFFILELLGLPVTEIKISPSKIDSTMNRIGFKDILKFIHLKQKDIASDSLLDMNNRSRYVKHKEVLKYLLNIHNEDISRINSEISANASIEKNKKNQKANVISFLEASDFDFSINIEDEINKWDVILCDIDKEIDALKNNHKNVLSFTDGLKNEVDELSNSLNDINQRKPRLISDLDKYVKLKNTYNEEKKSLSTSIDIGSKFDILQQENVSCPLCSTRQVIESRDSIIPLSVLKNEKKSVNRKLKSLNTIIDNIRCEILAIEKEEDATKIALHEIQCKFNKKYSKEVSALIESISFLEKEKVEILSSKKLISRDKKFLDRLNMIEDELNNLSKIIDRLNGDLKKAESNSQDPKDVINNLNDIFVKIMELSGLTDMNGLSVNGNLDYIVRNKDFVNLTSGGVRTITSIAIYLSKLVYAMKYDSNMPTLFMLDTPGNNIGRNRKENILCEEASDPTIYENIYARLESVYNLAKKVGCDFQIIVVDNDLANKAEGNSKFYIAKRFSKSDDDFDSGLINDFILKR